MIVEIWRTVGYQRIYVFTEASMHGHLINAQAIRIEWQQ
jgi:hypothetical protein